MRIVANKNKGMHFCTKTAAALATVVAVVCFAVRLTPQISAHGDAAALTAAGFIMPQGGAEAIKTGFGGDDKEDDGPIAPSSSSSSANSSSSHPMQSAASASSPPIRKAHLPQHLKAAWARHTPLKICSWRITAHSIKGFI